MEIEVNSGNNGSYLIFSGPMTCENSRQIENRIINAMRQHSQLCVDLSAVQEIDLCGIHLLGVLQSFGGDAVHIIATSPTVDAALLHLPSTHRHAKLKQHVKTKPYLPAEATFATAG